MRVNFQDQLAATRIAKHDTQIDNLDVQGALKVAGVVLSNAANLYGRMQPVAAGKCQVF
jgi:hypothetical protein